MRRFAEVPVCDCGPSGRHAGMRICSRNDLLKALESARERRFQDREFLEMRRRQTV